MDAFTTPEAEVQLEQFDFPMADKLGKLIIKLDSRSEVRGRKYAALGQTLSFGLVFIVISAIGCAAQRAESHYAHEAKVNQEVLAKW